MLVSYVKRTQKTALDHIRPFEFIQKQAKLSIDANSMRNLELIQSIRNGSKDGTLYWLLDETVTAMGARKLKMWIHQPLAEKREIENRLDAVTELIEEFFLRDELKTSLKEVYDLGATCWTNFNGERKWKGSCTTSQFTTSCPRYQKSTSRIRTATAQSIF